jgi:hypothetical protein
LPFLLLCKREERRFSYVPEIILQGISGGALPSARSSGATSGLLVPLLIAFSGMTKRSLDGVGIFGLNFAFGAVFYHQAIDRLKPFVHKSLLQYI